ncbi:tetratricopeptide repeat protein [Penaeicola halotolerans]|uniref:type IX secretion system periplasmic lipoprotein PorW/SprE n=1 Tax=Penaeicola halotolerans TaxID=2793196 RepID=UPI001CF8F66B|nr:tetratricopeptide repeat protein [Penaeicola halotolerans]
MSDRMPSKYFKYFFVLLMSFLFACSAEKDTLTSKLYHNTTAYYNAYFIAREDIREVEQAIKEDHRDDFLKTIPIFYAIDSTTIESKVELLNDAIKKASIGIEWHKNSDWVYDCYYMIGLANFYKGRFADAITAFKYVNTKSDKPDLRHEALISLMRAFMYYGEMDNAYAVSEFLSKESLNKDNQRRFALMMAHYYELKGDLNGIVKYLEEALLYTKKGKEKSRYYFILAQIYQSLDFEAAAFDYYDKSLNGNPSYEQSFYAQLYMQQVFELKKTNDLKRVRKYYESLLKNKKNRDLRDVIYYEMGIFETRQNNLTEAAKMYQQSAQSSRNNPSQKAYAYLKLYALNYYDFKNFSLAQNYLDSAFITLPDSEIALDSLSKKKEILDTFNGFYQQRNEADSLIRLNALGTTAQRVYFEKYLAEKEAERIAAEKANKKRRLFGLLSSDPSGSSQVSTADGNTWYFYNIDAVNQGRLEFKQKWSSRPLEDNWRRSIKEVSGTNEEEISPEEEEVKEEEVEETELISASTLMEQIYRDSTQIATLKVSLSEALFRLGEIYFNNLSQNLDAEKSLLRLIDEFPDSEYHAEALYLLHLISLELDKAEQAASAKQQLIDQYPSSTFAQLLQNPNFREEESANNSIVGQKYAEAYSLYEQEAYLSALKLINETLEAYPNTTHTERLLLLEIIVGQKMELNKALYDEQLKSYIENVKDPKLKSMAQKMLDVSQQLISSQQIIQSGFSTNLSQVHVLAVEVTDSKADAERVSALVNAFNEQYYSDSMLKSGQVAFDTKVSLVLVSPLANKQRALEYLEQLTIYIATEDPLLKAKIDTFVITNENYQKLSTDKNLSQYKTFFRLNYK